MSLIRTGSRCLRSLHLLCWYTSLLRCIHPAPLIQVIGVCIPGEVPRGVHHLREVEVVIDPCTDIIEVFHKFLLGNGMIWLLVVEEVVMGLEGLEELTQDLLRGLSTLEDCRVLLRVVNGHQVLHLYSAISISIKFLERLEH